MLTYAVTATLDILLKQMGTEEAWLPQTQNDVRGVIRFLHAKCSFCTKFYDIDSVHGKDVMTKGDTEWSGLDLVQRIGCLQSALRTNSCT